MTKYDPHYELGNLDNPQRLLISASGSAGRSDAIACMSSRSFIIKACGFFLQEDTLKASVLSALTTSMAYGDEANELRKLATLFT